MATEVRLPQWGMGMQEGTITEWQKREGEAVERGEIIAEIEAAKSVEELAAPASGVLARIVVEEGRAVPVHELLALIAAPGEEVTSPAPNAGGATGTGNGPAGAGGDGVAPEASGAVSEPAASGVAARGNGAHTRNVVPLARKLAEERGIDLATVHGSGPGGRITADDVRRAADPGASPARRATDRTSASPGGARATAAHVGNVVPRARRMAKDHGVDLASIRGSGPGGRITVADVEAVLTPAAPVQEAEPVTAAGAAPAGTGTQAGASEGERIPMTGMRGVIAGRMHASLQSTAQLTLVTTADVTDLVGYREQIPSSPRPTYTDLVVKAAALALRRHPALNARVEQDAIVRLADVHVGIATALEDGLVVPVLRHADRKPLPDLAAESAELTQRARSGKASAAEISGSTFTVTSLGGQGIDAFTPILNPPEVAILGVGRIVDHPSRYGTSVVWRKAMTLSLTIDHRVVDGAPGAAFLQTVVALLADPVRLAG